MFCVLEVFCLSVVRGFLDVFGDLLPPCPPSPYLIRTGVYTVTESIDIVQAQNTFQDAEHFSCLANQSF